MSETLPTDALPKLGNDVFYDIRVLSAKVNSLVITAKDSPEKAEELYLSVLTTVCVYVENYLASHFSGLNSEYFERFCYSNIYGAEHRFTSLKKLAELSAYTLNSVPQNMCDKNECEQLRNGICLHKRQYSACYLKTLFFRRYV